MRQPEPKGAVESRLCEIQHRPRLQTQAQVMVVPFIQEMELNRCMSPNLSRVELASLTIPPVACGISTAHVSNSRPPSGSSPTDPFSLVMRPCEAVVDCAQGLFDRQEHHAPIATVHIKDLGHFSEDGIQILKKFCSLSFVRNDVMAEAAWLSRNVDGLTTKEVALLTSALWHKAPNAVLLRHKSKMIDVRSFSFLALERHIDNFTIDVCIHYFNEEAQTLGHHGTIILPLEVWSWLRAKSDKYLERKLLENVNVVPEPELLLVPVHMSGCHWGLAVVDFRNKDLLFDDGLQFTVQRETIRGLKSVLDALHKCYPNNPSFKGKFWSGVQSLRRFGMPSQASKDAGMASSGAGSCGIGVILSARDFIHYGSTITNGFQWTYAEMSKLRKILMLKILDWGLKNP